MSKKFVVVTIIQACILIYENFEVCYYGRTRVKKVIVVWKAQI
jgi:hypothetical protein